MDAFKSVSLKFEGICLTVDIAKLTKYIIVAIAACAVNNRSVISQLNSELNI